MAHSIHELLFEWSRRAGGNPSGGENDLALLRQIAVTRGITDAGTGNKTQIYRAIAATYGKASGTENYLGALRSIVDALDVVPLGYNLGDLNERECLAAIVGNGIIDIPDPDLHLECTAIGGATSSTYVLQAGDEGFYIRCKVTATNSEGSDTAWSNAVGPVAAASGGTPYTLAPEILGWKLNEGSGTALTGDATNGGDDGTTDAAWVAGKSGSGGALDFNGTTDDAQTNAAITFGVNQITVCAWVWLDDDAPTQILWELSADYGANNGSFVCYIDSGVIVAGMRAADGNTAKSVVAPAEGAWVHLAIHYDSPASTNVGDFTFYFDGVAQAKTDLVPNKTASPNFAVAVVNVGARNGASLFFNGRIDDLRIYDHLLDAGELAAVIADPQ